jgi:peptidoglycan/xylan/chitin deacetylase (PgdA/CDA1 family)
MTVSTTEFEWQLRYLRRHYTPISLQQFTNWYFGAASRPRNPVMITFDDGHSNNLNFALPILKKFDVPAVCFAVAGFLGTTTLTWFEDAYMRLMFSPAAAWSTANGEHWPLANEEQRRRACGRFFTLSRNLNNGALAKELELLRSQLPVPPLNGNFPGRFEFLSREQLRRLQQNGVEIGAHTIRHPILAGLSGEEAKTEIANSKRELESALGGKVCAFAYPFGAPRLDFTDREREYARQCGFVLAFAGEGGFASRASDPFCIPRIGIGRMSRAQFAAAVTGTTERVKDLIHRQFRKRPLAS